MTGAARFSTYLEKQDPQLFRQLVERWRPRVFGLCARLFPDRADAEDITQEVFLALFRRREPFPDDTALDDWLCGAAVNLARRRFRSRARRRARERRYERAEPALPRGLDERELAEALGRKIAALPATIRLPLVLHQLEGQPMRRIARQLGCSVGTVHNRVQDGLSRLRASLQESGYTASALGLLALLPAPPTSAPLALAALVPSGQLKLWVVAVLLVTGAATLSLRAPEAAPAPDPVAVVEREAAPERVALPDEGGAPVELPVVDASSESGTSSAPGGSEAAHAPAPAADAAEAGEEEADDAARRRAGQHPYPYHALEGLGRSYQQTLSEDLVAGSEDARRAYEAHLNVAGGWGPVASLPLVAIEGMMLMEEAHTEAAHPLDAGECRLSVVVRSRAGQLLRELEARLWIADPDGADPGRPLFRSLPVEAGEVHAEGLPGGLFLLELAAADHIPSYLWVDLVADEALSLEVFLETPVLVRGRIVTRARLPVAGVRVTGGGAEAVSEADGSFALSPLWEPGTYDLALFHPDYVPATAAVRIPPSELHDQTRIVELPPLEIHGALNLSGLVRGPEGPVAGATIDIDGGPVATSDGDGRFQFVQLEARPHTLFVSSGERVAIAASERTRPGSVELVVDLAPGGRLTILPADPQASAVQVSWWKRLHGVPLSASVVDGRAELRGLFPGLYQVGGQFGGRIETVELLPGEHRTVDLGAPQNVGSLSGVVHDPQDIAGDMPVYVFAMAPDFNDYVEVGADGTYTFASLPEGPCELFLRCPDRGVGRASVTVSGATERSLTLLPGGVLRGTVVDNQGRPVEDAVVETGMVGFGGRRETRTDADGSFQLFDIYPYGHYDLVVESPLGSTALVLVDPGEAPVRVQLP